MSRIAFYVVSFQQPSSYLTFPDYTPLRYSSAITRHFSSSSLGHVGRISGHVLRLLLVAALVVFLLLALLILVLLNSSLGDELLEDEVVTLFLGRSLSLKV